MTFYSENSIPAGYATKTGAFLEFQSMIDTGLKIQFIAYLDNLSQDFNSTWNAEQVYGRNDDIATFQGTKRSYSISWTLPAKNLEEAQSNLKNCGALTKMLYPQYNTDRKDLGNQVVSQNALSISKSPLIRLKFANLIINSVNNEGLLGYITNVNWTPSLEMGMFASNQEFYPKVIRLSINFNVLHEHQLGFSKSSTEKDFGGAIGFPFKGN
tara:strand:- start:237 stop:872 length:636 start_codon:yes stop_codon:yes gene_type:complete